MNTFKERYIVDEKGDRISVILDIEDYQHLLEELEELECIRAYDTAKFSNDEIIPFEQAISEIEPAC
jgi:hypothetical protein